MTPHAKWAIAGVVLGLILFIVSPWLAIGVILLALAVPTVAYLMLDHRSAGGCAKSAAGRSASTRRNFRQHRPRPPRYSATRLYDTL